MSSSDVKTKKSGNSSDSEASPEVQAVPDDKPDALVACERDLNKWKDSCLRVTADFENFKKRTEKEKINWIKMAQSNVIQGLLDVVDDFDRVLSEAKKHEISEELEGWVKGFELTSKSIYKFLDHFDVHEIKDHEIFNPEYHEAIMRVDSQDHISGAIVNVIQKGYLFKDMVLRPAKVSVAK